MSIIKEQPVTFHYVTESGNDTSYFRHHWFEVRIGDIVIGEGNSLEDAIYSCDTDIDLEVGKNEN